MPCYLALVLDEHSENAYLAAGAAARPDARAAALKALLEALQTRTWLRQMVHSGRTPESVSYDQVAQFEDHVLLWGQRHMLPHISFLLQQDRTVALRTPAVPPDPRYQVAWVVERLKCCGLPALVVDLTTTDLRQANFDVVRALVPGAVPLNSDHRHRPLGSPRLYSVPPKLGRRAPRGPLDLNPVAHPFP